jgi:hypothetical protein
MTLGQAKTHRLFLLGVAMAGVALTSPASAFFRGGGFHGGGFGGFHGGDFGGFHGGGFGGFHGGAYGGFHGGGFGGGAWHGNAWHAGGWGGTWHGDGWHAGGYYAGGFHGPVAVNHFYAGGCWSCAGLGGAAIAGAAGLAAGAAIGAAATAGQYAYPIGSMIVTPPDGCAFHPYGSINYDVCGNTWLRPYYGNNGLYYRVVAAP